MAGRQFEGWFRPAGRTTFGHVLRHKKLGDVKVTQQALADEPRYWEDYAELVDPRENRQEKVVALTLQYGAKYHVLRVTLNLNRPEVSYLDTFLQSEALERKVETYLKEVLEKEVANATWRYDPGDYLDN